MVRSGLASPHSLLYSVSSARARAPFTRPGVAGGGSLPSDFSGTHSVAPVDIRPSGHSWLGGGGGGGGMGGGVAHLGQRRAGIVAGSAMPARWTHWLSDGRIGAGLYSAVGPHRQTGVSPRPPCPSQPSYLRSNCHDMHRNSRCLTRRADAVPAMPRLRITPGALRCDCVPTTCNRTRGSEDREAHESQPRSETAARPASAIVVCGQNNSSRTPGAGRADPDGHARANRPRAGKPRGRPATTNRTMSLSAPQTTLDLPARRKRAACAEEHEPGEGAWRRRGMPRRLKSFGRLCGTPAATGWRLSTTASSHWCGQSPRSCALSSFARRQPVGMPFSREAANDFRRLVFPPPSHAPSPGRGSRFGAGRSTGRMSGWSAVADRDMRGSRTARMLSRRWTVATRMRGVVAAGAPAFREASSAHDTIAASGLFRSRLAFHGLPSSLPRVRLHAVVGH